MRQAFSIKGLPLGSERVDLRMEGLGEHGELRVSVNPVLHQKLGLGHISFKLQEFYNHLQRATGTSRGLRRLQSRSRTEYCGRRYNKP